MKRSKADILREYGPFPGVDQVAGVTFDGAITRFFVVNADGSLSTGTVDATGNFSGFVSMGGFITAVPAAAAGL